MKFGDKTKRFISVSIFVVVSGTTYFIYDTKEQLFDRSVYQKFYSLTPERHMSASEPDSKPNSELEYSESELISAPNQGKPFLTDEEIDYVISNAGLEGCISGYVVDGLKERHKKEIAEMEDLEIQNDTQMEIIHMYQEKDNPIFGGWTGFAVSAIVGKLVLSFLSMPGIVFNYFRKK